MGGLFTKDIAVLDVTSRLMSAIIGAKKAQSVFGIKALAEREYSGFENGEWYDEAETREIAQKVLKDALSESGSKTKRLFIGVPSEFVAVVTKEISVTLDRERKVIDADVDYLLKKGDTFDTGRYITINTSAIYYATDTSDKLFNDVRGFSARQIEACVSYILCEKRFVRLFDGIAETLGFKEVQYVASAWAEGLALFEKEQRDNVYVLIDVDYISTSVTIGKGEGVIDLKSFSMGGGHICADMYEALEIPFELAVQAKELVDLNLSYPDEVSIVGDAEHRVLANDACEVVRARLDVFAEIIGEILKETENDAPAYMPVYLTGEGISSIRGAKKYLSEQLGKNIETVTPKLPGFVKPSDSSKISLLIVAESLSKSGFGDAIKRLLNGGKI